MLRQRAGCRIFKEQGIRQFQPCLSNTGLRDLLGLKRFHAQFEEARRDVDIFGPIKAQRRGHLLRNPRFHRLLSFED